MLNSSNRFSAEDASETKAVVSSAYCDTGIQDMQDRVFLCIRYLYPDETPPEMRKRPKKWADLCEAKIGEPSSSRISSILGLPLL